MTTTGTQINETVTTTIATALASFEAGQSAVMDYDGLVIQIARTQSAQWGRLYSVTVLDEDNDYAPQDWRFVITQDCRFAGERAYTVVDWGNTILGENDNLQSALWTMLESLHR
jgi:hypothetical protein